MEVCATKHTMLNHCAKTPELSSNLDISIYVLSDHQSCSETEVDRLAVATNGPIPKMISKSLYLPVVDMIHLGWR